MIRGLITGRGFLKMLHQYFLAGGEPCILQYFQKKKQMKMKFSANGCPNGVKSSPVTFLHHIIPSITFMIRVVSITNAITTADTWPIVKAKAKILQ